MQKYQVTLNLIIGYNSPEQEPICIKKEIFVTAKNYIESINKAKKLDKSNLSVYESYAKEIIAFPKRKCNFYI